MQFRMNIADNVGVDLFLPPLSLPRSLIPHRFLDAILRVCWHLERVRMPAEKRKFPVNSGAIHLRRHHHSSDRQ